MNPWIERVYNTIQTQDLFDEGDTVVVALSGGADSVTLLHILYNLKDRLCLKGLHAAHLHHGLRGEEADRDEQFVRKLCESYRIPLTVSHVDVSKEADLHKESVEEAGRRLRYDLFNRVADSLDAPVKIAVAHNADDLAETVLFHIMRGSGLTGLRGIPVKRGRIVRPLLEMSSEAVRSFCLQENLTYMTDQTNAQLIYTRNRIRHVLLPEMESIHPGSTANILRLSKIAAEEDDYLQQESDKLIEQARLPFGYDARAFRMASDILTRRALMTLLWRECGVRADRQQADAMLRVVRNGGRFGGLPSRAVISCEQDLLIFQSAFQHQTIPDDTVLVPDQASSFGAITICPRLLNQQEFSEKSKIHKNFLYYCADYDMITGSISVHSKHSKDELLPFEKRHRKPLKKWFNEWKIPTLLRPLIPVIQDESGVVAVPGYAVDQRVAVTPVTKQIIWFHCTTKINEKDGQ